MQPLSQIDAHALPVKVISGVFYRQTAPARGALDVPAVAKTSGRYHRRRGEARLYASSSQAAAWGELFRHVEPEISPFEVRRRMSKLRVSGLAVLDLTDPDVRQMVGVSVGNLVSNRPTVCRKIADVVRRAPERYGGILAPSAVDPDAATTLVVFREWIEPAVTVAGVRVGTPPTRLFGLLRRVIGTLPPPVKDRMLVLAAEIERQLKRRLRST